MMRIRPVKLDDHAQVLELAKTAGIGMSSLPQDADVLREKIANAVRSFEGNPLKTMEESFLFVLEDTEHKRLAGTTGVVAHVGLTRPFYSYKLSTITQASSAIGVYSQEHVLHMVNDYTGATEIGSLFLHPDYRNRWGIGKVLSRCRYLMLAEFPHLFSDMVISEVRGVQDKEGNSPFYDNIARHFFRMDFKKADYIYATQGGQFIADLMPRYPIYVNLLPTEAQAVIGVSFAASKPAMQLLLHEGFRYEGYLDLFDAGPTLQADRQHIRTVRKSHKASIKSIGSVKSEPHIISNTRLKDFMIAVGGIEKDGDGVVIEPALAEAINVKKGDMVRYAL
jgi:arginine N-succinyltransferase